jgi:hypothetical protein
MKAYSTRRVGSRTNHNKNKSKRILIVALIALVVVVGVIIAIFLINKPTPEEKVANTLQFDGSVTPAEQQAITSAIQEQSKSYDGNLTVSVKTAQEIPQSSAALAVYVPVTDKYAARQQINKSELAGLEVYLPKDTGEIIRQAVATLIGIGAEKLKTLDSSAEAIGDNAVAFIPSSELSANVKLLNFNGQYYLDSFKAGAIFRQPVFSGDSAGNLDGLALNSLPTKDGTLKVNMTGVTALTREMMDKLAVVGNATYFSEKIGPFLADADITHVSNEVSFQPGCAYSHSVFCSPPEMIEALKASGVDLVELTGNHNNDVGRQYNTDTINQYHELGWGTFGGGLNAEEAAKPFISDKKGTKVAFLAYNYADSPGGGAIATADGAGANPWNADKVQAEIAEAKKQADFVIVDVQYWECYSYPDGYVEFPECDVPIGQQSATFRQAADFGADMVIGSSAHQPQTYEVYNGTPIYYGLGNLYFEQTSWPGTERGIILTHYFQDGKLLQTKLSPTVYDSAYQTHLMANDEALYLLDRLKTARQTAGL